MVDHSKVSCANLEKLRNIFKALLCYKDSSKSLNFTYIFLFRGVDDGINDLPRCKDPYLKCDNETVKFLQHNSSSEPNS